MDKATRDAIAAGEFKKGCGKLRIQYLLDEQSTDDDAYTCTVNGETLNAENNVVLIDVPNGAVFDMKNGQAVKGKSKAK